MGAAKPKNPLHEILDLSLDDESAWPKELFLEEQADRAAPDEKRFVPTRFKPPVRRP